MTKRKPPMKKSATVAQSPPRVILCPRCMGRAGSHPETKIDRSIVLGGWKHWACEIPNLMIGDDLQQMHIFSEDPSRGCVMTP